MARGRSSRRGAHDDADSRTDPDLHADHERQHVDAAETAGAFLPLNPDGANLYEIETGTVLICPFVSPDA